MYDGIVLNTEELRRAEQGIGQLINQLTMDKKELVNQHNRLADWRGAAADELDLQIHQFVPELTGWISRLEEQRKELLAFIQLAEHVDSSCLSSTSGAYC